MLMEEQPIPIAEIYVPMALRKALDPKAVEAAAEKMLEQERRPPVLVRKDGARYVLVEGLAELEASKALGEETIMGLLVQGRPR
jgi:hypothetical protein